MSGLTKYYEFDWNKVRHWTDLKKIMQAMNLNISEPKDKPLKEFDPIRHLLKEKEE